MKFKIDENLPHQVAILLLQSGHDAATVRDEQLAGARDEDLAGACLREERALITLDLDFSDITVYPPARYPGIVVLRLSRQDKPHVLHAIQRLLGSLSAEPLSGRLWVVEEERLRIRGEEPEP